MAQRAGQGDAVGCACCTESSEAGRSEGPHLGRPHVDTLYGSKIPNLKELRVQSNGRPVRGFFVFDPMRKAIVLCAGNKEGADEKRFYKTMIKTAENEYHRHLDQLKRSAK